MRYSFLVLLPALLLLLYAVIASTIVLPEHVAPGHSGSPVENGRTCATSGCHTSGGTGTGGPGTPFQIETSVASFVPGEPVDITISINEPDQPYYRPGFQVAVVRGGAHTGTLSLVNTAKTAFSGSAQNPDPNYVSHRAPDSNTRQWTVRWEPAEGAGDVQIYAAGLSRFAGRVYSHSVTLPRAAPSAPALVSPENDATGVSTSPTLSWNESSGATRYHLQVSTQSNFASTVYNEDNITGTSRQVAGLSEGTLYHWRTRAGNAGGWGDWSEVWSFTTEVAAPASPALVSPENDATGVSTSPTLTWNASSGAAEYHLQVSTEDDFASTVVSRDDLTETSLQLSDLSNGTVYHWRVRAANEGGTSDWSTAWRFTTEASGVGTDPEGPELTPLALSAYPNPFGEHATISFSLPQDGDVRVVVFDVAGRETAVMARGWYRAGEHHILFDGTALPAGVYVVRLESGESFVSTRLVRTR